MSPILAGVFGAVIQDSKLTMKGVRHEAQVEGVVMLVSLPSSVPINLTRPISDPFACVSYRPIRFLGYSIYNKSCRPSESVKGTITRLIDLTVLSLLRLWLVNEPLYFWDFYFLFLSVNCLSQFFTCFHNFVGTEPFCFGGWIAHPATFLNKTAVFQGNWSLELSLN
jgi:hypothetical protein